jgi:glycosyltransferase involved in cell wall biosynthesis
MDRSRVAIVIPALNESNTIGSLVEASGAYGTPVVVDDGSLDDTAEIARLAGAIVISHTQNLGYDAALNSGFMKAAALDCKVVVTLDADGQHDPSLLKKFIDCIDSGYDVVIGVRNKKQRLAEFLFAWYADIRFRIKDPLCGMKAYRMTVYKALGHFDSYRSIGTELAIFAAKNKFRIGQIFLDVKERQDEPRFDPNLLGNYKILRAMLLSMLRLPVSQPGFGAPKS